MAVLGVPDQKWGETVAAVVRLRHGVDEPSEQDLTAFCRDRLARYKLPVRWFVTDRFPQTPSGKIKKFELRDLITRDAGADEPLRPLAGEHRAPREHTAE
ncbi:AMP-binding enzyme [Rhodococcus koreensis]